ncbi:hypothetical protein, partial [Mycobacterium avium]
PANSEGMLISLAAELEAVSGWASKQPQPWWDQSADTPPAPGQPAPTG